MMKKWLTIISLLLWVAIASAEQTDHLPQHLSAPTAQLSQADAEQSSALSAPLSATATAPLQLCGSASTPSKGNSYHERNQVTMAQYSAICNQLTSSQIHIDRHPKTVVCLHSLERYIYFIRRITI